MKYFIGGTALLAGAGAWGTYAIFEQDRDKEAEALAFYFSNRQAVNAPSAGLTEPQVRSLLSQEIDPLRNDIATIRKDIATKAGLTEPQVRSIVREEIDPLRNDIGTMRKDIAAILKRLDTVRPTLGASAATPHRALNHKTLPMSK